MSIRGRLRKLEQIKRDRVCSICGGNGTLVVDIIDDGQPEPREGGCPECGKAIRVVISGGVPDESPTPEPTTCRT